MFPKKLKESFEQNRKTFFAVGLVLILLLAAWFRFVNITTFDIHHDNALYSFRSLGWFDFIGGGQTTPYNWFEKVPVWATLSFHDAPPLAFIIQKTFFTFFGNNTFAARLPYALAGLGAVWLVYLLLSKAKSKGQGLLAGLLLAVSSYAIWSSNTGYLEGILMFFIALSLWAFWRFVERPKQSKHFYIWVLTIALALMVKYTALFLIPAALVWFFIERRGDYLPKKQLTRKIVFSIIIGAIILLPVIIYNINIFVSRGHFDAALSSILGMHPQDFATISGRQVGFSLSRTYSGFKVMLNAISPTLCVIYFLSLVYLPVKRWVLKKKDKFDLFIFLNLLFLLLMFAFSGAEQRFFAIVLPLLVISGSIFIFDIFEFLKTKQKYLAGAFAVIIILSIGLETSFAVNNQVILHKKDSTKDIYNQNRVYSFGWNELESYLKQNVFPKQLIFTRPSSLANRTLSQDDIKGKNIIIYDDRIEWFAYSWYLQKYQFYYRLPILPISLLFQPNVGQKLINQLKSAGAKDFYFIYPLTEDVKSSAQSGVGPYIDKTVQQLENEKTESVTIKNALGIDEFKVYKINL